MSSSYRYAVKDGFAGLLRHPLVLLASISTMTLMLLIMNLFTIFTFNANHLVSQLGQQPPVEIEFELDTNQEMVTNVVTAINADENVKDATLRSPKENFESFKKRMGKSELFDDETLLKSIPASITLRMKDPSLGATFQEKYGKMPGVSMVRMEPALLSRLQKLTRMVLIGSAVMFVLLGLVSVFIIVNLVRLAALSRATEISIMKFIGATNRYISVPYVIEGITVGIVGAILSILLVTMMYAPIYKMLSGGSIAQTLSVLPFRSLMPVIVGLSLLIGLVIGSLASILSIRRYADV